VISAYAKQSREVDRKEASPIPMALIVAWELMVCNPCTPFTTVLFLGAVLLCTHASLRFGDAQRIEWHTLQLSAQGLHGTAYATKTTKFGQPFACTWHGISGRDSDSSWVLKWLASIAAVAEQAPLAPDFVFFHADLGKDTHPQTFPCSYAQALLCLRYLAQQAGLDHAEAAALTLHSLKTTLLAAGAQMHFAEQSRLAQGHHRDSLRLYSRNDTLEALRLQREMAAQIAAGWRPQRSMARGGAAPVPEPPFEVSPALPPRFLQHEALLAGPWSVFTSRHESMHSGTVGHERSDEHSPGTHKEQQHENDPEAEMVAKHAAENPDDSDDDSDDLQSAPAPEEETFVCSGPWNALHTPTASSVREWRLLYGSEPGHGWVLQAACGAQLGDFPVVINTHDPVSACRRKACMLARIAQQA